MPSFLALFLSASVKPDLEKRIKFSFLFQVFHSTRVALFMSCSRISIPSVTFSHESTREYDPATDTWATKTPMPTARYGLTSGVVNGKIYVIGGNINTVEEYDPATDTWATRTPMPTRRYWLTSSMVNGKIYAIGGYSYSTSYLNTVEEYDPATDTWTTKTPMPSPRARLTSSAVNGKIYVIGGYSYLNMVEEYTPPGQ